VTTSGFLEHQLIYYKDSRTGKIDEGLTYANDILQYCSVQMLDLLTFGEPPVPYLPQVH